MPMTPTVPGPGISLSPEIQSYNQQPEAQQDPEQLFKERFNQMAYNVLYSRLAEIAPEVVTFKILNVDVDAGKGVGVFVVMHEQTPIYIPVILTDGKLKPMEMFYAKTVNMFLPLMPQWLDEIGKMSLNELGSGADLPKNVPQDVNIRDLVMPPTTTSGRIGLASDNSYDPRRLFKEAENHELNIRPQFLNIMRTAPLALLDGVKLAFSRNPGLLQKFAANYGINQLTAAMSDGYSRAQSQVKTAFAKTGRVTVLSKNASSQQFNEVFGVNAGKAFAQMLKVGVAIQDTRDNFAKVAVKTEGPAFLESPGSFPGWFRLYFVDGKPSIYFVVPLIKKSGSSLHQYNDYNPNNEHKPEPQEYVVISPDCKEMWVCNDAMGEKLQTLPNDIINSRLFKLLTSDAKGDTPSAKSYGLFLNPTRNSVEATMPIEVEEVYTDNDVTRLKTFGTTWVVEKDPQRKNIKYTSGSSLNFVPSTAKYLEMAKRTGEDYWKTRDKITRRKNSVINDPKVLLKWMNNVLAETGAKPVNVKSAGLNQWWINGQHSAMYFAPALEKVANDYSISTGDALGILLDAREHGRSSAFLLEKSAAGLIKQAFGKFAQPPGPPQEQPMQYEGSMQGAPTMGGPGTPQGMSPAGGKETSMGPGGAPPTDPNTGQPAQQAPQQSSMSPTDLAIGEAIQGLQQQNELATQQNQAQMQQLQQKMEMEMQQNQSLVQVLQGIQQRAQSISSATGGMVPAGAEQSPMVSAQMIAPIPPEEPPPPPTPMMDEQTLNMSPEMVAQQINPQMVDQAQQLGDQGTFDTAAIAMLAAAPILQDIVAAYIPNLEKAVDNLGRVLLTLWMKESDTKKAIGDEAFMQLEEKLRNVFKGVGEVVLDLTNNATSVGDEAERDKQQTGQTA